MILIYLDHWIDLHPIPHTMIYPNWLYRFRAIDYVNKRTARDRCNTLLKSNSCNSLSLMAAELNPFVYHLGNHAE